MSTPPVDDLQPPAPTCAAQRRDGTPCQGRPLAESPYCFGHQPGANAARAKGGRQRSNVARAAKAVPPKLQVVAGVLESALAKTFEGRMKPQVASALAALAGAYVRVVSAGEIEQRVADLERALAGRRA
jgi:hypothetical protein